MKSLPHQAVGDSGQTHKSSICGLWFQMGVFGPEEVPMLFDLNQNESYPTYTRFGDPFNYLLIQCCTRLQGLFGRCVQLHLFEGFLSFMLETETHKLPNVVMTTNSQQKYLLVQRISNTWGVAYMDWYFNTHVPVDMRLSGGSPTPATQTTSTSFSETLSDGLCTIIPHSGRV